MTSSVRLRVFFLFAAGYFVSYVFRGVNLGFAPLITHELGLSAADLGLLTSLYFIGFAARANSRRRAARSLRPAPRHGRHAGVRGARHRVFGVAHGLAGMMAGRLLIGVGVSVCLSAAFKASAQHFPVARLPLVNGSTMAMGGLGGVVVGSPLASLLASRAGAPSARGSCVFTLVVAAAISAVRARASATARHQADIVTQFKGTWHILRSAAFWKIASFSVVTQGVFYAMQSLWIRPYLLDVMGLSASHAAALVSVLGFAMMAAASASARRRAAWSDAGVSGVRVLRHRHGAFRARASADAVSRAVAAGGAAAPLMAFSAAPAS